jgi:3-oxoacyl-[acyl-carrier-protein] synthase-3
MRFTDIGIVGTGLWEGEPVGNEFFGDAYGSRTKATDPYRGRKSEGGTVNIGGMELAPDKYPRTLAAIERAFKDPFRGGVRRRFFPADLKVSDAESEAAGKAIADAGLTAADIGAVLVQSVIPDEVLPKNAGIIAHNLGIKNAPAWELDSICNSTLSHLTVACSLIVSGFARHVLCVQSAAYSRVRDPGSSSSLQEADMAGAFVVGPSPGARIATSWRTDGKLHGAIKFQWKPPTGAPTRRWWEPSQERLLIHFDKPLQEQVMAEIAENARRVCDEAMGRAELRYDELELFVGHQPTVWITAFLEDVLGLREGIAFDTFAEYANANSATFTASVHEARRAGRLRRGTKALFFAPAAGYTFGALALTW